MDHALTAIRKVAYYKHERKRGIDQDQRESEQLEGKKKHMKRWSDDKCGRVHRECSRRRPINRGAISDVENLRAV